MTTRNCVYVSKERFDETLAMPPTDGKRLLEPLKTISREQTFPVNILEDQNVSNDAEVHMHEADLWCCVEGEVTFIVDGKLKDPIAKVLQDGSVDSRELHAKEIIDGNTIVLHSGDWLWIPAGQPHQHICKGTARLLIIKIPNAPMAS